MKILVGDSCGVIIFTTTQNFIQLIGYLDKATAFRTRSTTSVVVRF
jgi:hypothetical protein